MSSGSGYMEMRCSEESCPNFCKKKNASFDADLEYRDLLLTTSRMLDGQQLEELMHMCHVTPAQAENVQGHALRFLQLLEKRGDISPNNFSYLKDRLKRSQMGKILKDFTNLTNDFNRKVRENDPETQYDYVDNRFLKMSQIPDDDDELSTQASHADYVNRSELGYNSDNKSLDEAAGPSTIVGVRLDYRSLDQVEDPYTDLENITIAEKGDHEKTTEKKERKKKECKKCQRKERIKEEGCCMIRLCGVKFVIR